MKIPVETTIHFPSGAQTLRTELEVSDAEVEFIASKSMERFKIGLNLGVYLIEIPYPSLDRRRQVE